MDLRILEKLKTITTEEKEIIEGNKNVQKSIYSSDKDFIIDSQKMLQKGKLIDVRAHTRFIHFPKHGHNYVEIIYMCSGSTTHIINDTDQVRLEEGELLFLNQNVTQEILPASENDIAVNFMILPQFFERACKMMESQNILQDFIIGTLQKVSAPVNYLHFQTKGILPIQNLIENMIWSLIFEKDRQNEINQTAMGLLFLYLTEYIDCFKEKDAGGQEQTMMFQVVRYVEKHYPSASLEEIAAMLHLPSYYVSKVIKKNSGTTFTRMLQKKRLSRAVYLLAYTEKAIEEIITAVGYENSSYFHRIFRNTYGMTPKMYREEIKH